MKRIKTPTKVRFLPSIRVSRFLLGIGWSPESKKPSWLINQKLEVKRP